MNILLILLTKNRNAPHNITYFATCATPYYQQRRETNVF